jgi:hypothetical protein
MAVAETGSRLSGGFCRLIVRNSRRTGRVERKRGFDSKITTAPALRRSAGNASANSRFG